MAIPTPADVAALASLAGGSAYGAVIDSSWPTNKLFKFIINVQTSFVFLVAFASVDYLRESTGPPGTTPGVAWTGTYLNGTMPVVTYLVLLLALITLSFHITITGLNNRVRWLLEAASFQVLLVLFYLALGYHVLTLDTMPVDFGDL